MAAYAIVQFDITDRGWVREYLKTTGAIIARHGGRYLARGSEHKMLEGDVRPEVLVLLEFPTMEALDGFYEDPEYVPLRDRRIAGTRGSFHVVDGT
jgi:uncharacterized protein (DUF1330 family)